MPKAGEVAHVRRRDRGRGGLRGRDVRVRHAPRRRARHHAGREGALGPRRRHARRPRDLGLPRPRRGRAARAPARSGRRRSTWTRWAGRSRSGSAATASPSPSTSTSSTGARAATCRSAASAASPPRRRSRCSSCGCSPGTPAWSARARRNLRVLVFNVKGEDLLWLDKPNRFFDEEAAAGWAALGVEPGPFPSVRFWAPPRRRSGDVVVPDTGGRHEGVDVFSWTPREFVDEDLPAVPVHRRERREEPDPVRPRARAGAAEAVRGRRRRACPGAVVLRDPRDAPDGNWRGQQVQAQPGETGRHATCSRWSTRSASSWSPRTAPSPTGRGAAG